MSTERNKRLGKIILWSGLGLLVLLGVLVRLLTIESVVQQKVQQAFFEPKDPLPSPGRFVYANDSLIYWNRNDVNPKLMRRKVSLGTDTVCQLPTGTYQVHAYQQADTTTYEFNLLNIRSNHEDDTPHIFSKSLYWILLLPLALILIGLLLIYRKKQNLIKVGPGILVVLIISIISTYIYSKTFTNRENQSLSNLAEHLVQKRDTRFELSYTGFVELVKTDTDFRDMVFAESNVLAELVLDYSKELLFDDNMNAYTVTLTLCAPHEEITIHPSGNVFDCEAYFIDKLNTNKNQKVGEDLYFLDYYTLDPNYLGKIEVISSDSLQRKTLYYEFYKPVAPEGFSLDYSVANYRDSLLVYKYGRYVYPNLVQSLKLNLDEFTYSKHYKHYAMRHGDNDILVISAARKGWSEATAPFALFFLGMLLPYLLVVWLLNAQRPRPWRDRSFRQRLQSVILLTLGISFLAMGPVSVLYMRSLYNQKTADAQFETTLTLVNEMRNDVDFGSLLRYASSDRWNDVLQRYANTFYTDINLYRLDGQLLATTRHEIFDNNLQAPLMNAEAYQSLHREQGLYFTHEEYLGQVVYESAYLPLVDNEGNLLAYLNTPFFSSRTDLQREIRNFVLTYLNIVLLLLGIALFFVLRLTQRLTKPLALIQDNLGRLKIDQKNEPIEWASNDEIGALVKQYNQLIVELEKSAAELRRTAAESAWRGVARQVAHEIHNSLTPMRLSVQMLQRSAEQQDNPVAERIQRTSSTLLEQIDALSDIASSFSQYAKLPVNNPQPLDLAELVGNLVNLYDNADNIKFKYEFDPAKDHTFNGDKTNLNSAIGNIIKNATQAIGTKPDGRVEVKLKSTENSYVISVKDNGKGIKEEDKKMIFVPNFTTKTGGSGVGLSLTYNIIQSAGGTITFDSREGKGAEFVITLPRT